MLTPLLSLLLAAPYPPVLVAPAPDGWSNGRGSEFETGAFRDDAGHPPLSVILEFRAEDGGYGAMNDTLPYASYLTPSQSFPVEGARWCWRARHVNTLNEVSDPSDERCFRTDYTQPVSGFVDAGAIASTGLVTLDLQPATDALSGVRGYALDLAPNPTTFTSGAGAPAPLPLQSWVGEGTWFGWVLVTDFAGNQNSNERDAYRVPITVTASPSVPVPDAPAFSAAVTNRLGDVLSWNRSWMVDAGVTHVVASFCNLDAGCEWRHGFQGASPNASSWQQLVGEGTYVARIAVVQGGEVGAWSAPTAPLLVDHTRPTIPGQVSSAPTAARTGPLSVSWLASTDDFTGVAHYGVQVKELLSGTTTTSQVIAPSLMTTVMPTGDGRYEVRVRAVDRAGNESELSAAAISVIDGTGPTSQRPAAVASAIDGGALVSITWALPADVLSQVSAMELRQVAQDGGAELVSVTGLAASRTVPPGEWRWQLRATDSLGNVGAFSEPSNAILVTAQGVVNGPSIVTGELEARCGEELSAQLQGEGDAPLSWFLLSGPPGLAVSSAGTVTWTPPAGSAADEVMRVKLSNTVGFVNADVQLQVSCEPMPAADGGVAREKTLLVGCGCSSLDPLFALGALVTLWRRRRFSGPPLSPK